MSTANIVCYWKPLKFLFTLFLQATTKQNRSRFRVCFHFQVNGIWRGLEIGERIIASKASICVDVLFHGFYQLFIERYSCWTRCQQQVSSIENHISSSLAVFSLFFWCLLLWKLYLFNTTIFHEMQIKRAQIV